MTDRFEAARIWQRCVMEELGGYDKINLGSYAEDYDLALKVSERYGVQRIPHVLYHYRMNHKREGEKPHYVMTHSKKTFARKSAVLRRQKIDGK